MNTFILSNYNELVDFLSSGMEMPCVPIGEFLYLLVLLVQTGKYQYVSVRSNLPVYVQVYRIPDGETRTSG